MQSRVERSASGAGPVPRPTPVSVVELGPARGGAPRYSQRPLAAIYKADLDTKRVVVIVGGHSGGLEG